MPRILPRRKRTPESRPFYTTVFLFAILAVYCLFVRGPSAAPALQQHHGRHLQVRADEECRLVHSVGVEDKCAFVKRNCRDDEPGLIQYLTLYYCNLGHAQPLAFIILVLWLGLLFTTIGITASDFFSVNLSTIATVLGLSESLAGVTFLAFGNGSPDVFSTFAAMGSNSGSMAIGELIGAAGFITTVVAGSMALVREFKVGKRTFVRDICFFIVAVCFAMGFLADGILEFWECCVMIAYYLFYVLVVVGWHAITKRRHARRAKEAAARSHFYAFAHDHGNDELEPYRDEPGDEDVFPDERRASSLVDVGALERGPRIEVDAADKGYEDDGDHSQHVAAEVASSMRVNRPRGRRSVTTITPIRPSLVGALEFRSVLSSLQKESNMRMKPIHARSRSADHIAFTVGESAQEPPASVHTVPAPPIPFSVARNRAHSSGAVPHMLDSDLSPRQSLENRIGTPSLHTIGGKLAPPLDDQMGGRPTGTSRTVDEAQKSPPQLHKLQIPSPPGSERSSPAVSPFPGYSDSPFAVTPSVERSSYTLPAPAMEHHPSLSTLVEHVHPKPVRWWPYQLLPAPHVLRNTLFPTLQGWREKSIWDKFISIISVPSIFLLVITLPVVESETTDDELEESIVEQPASGHLGSTAPTVSYESDGEIEPETEWQRYRRSTRSSVSSRSTSPALISFDSDHDASRAAGPNEAGQAIPTLNVQPPKPASELGQDNSTLPEEDLGWNRWLLILQIFIGPLFCVFIVWVNMAEDLDEPVKVLVRSLLISLVCSLVLLAVILTTTSPDHRPRYQFLFCFLGFVIAIAWISTVAGEVVGILKAFGVILDISDAILGLTIFAIGNSVGDLVADITVARLGYPVMALSACCGGPLLNILLGIGLGGAYQTIQAGNKRKAENPDEPFQYQPYHIEVNGTLMVSAVTLLVTLFTLLTVVPINKWIMSKKIGWGLIALWTTSTVLNLVIEVTGVWRNIA
ncbi:Sodium/calcium exchanger protein-domain-containing protein [Biscogniauxia mediterranea]|nr:Sodium/calcium exchanger protein-domain-containing protein [Biscogniauxia mediterranea]